MTIEAANRTAHSEAPGQHIPVLVEKLETLQSHAGDQNQDYVLYSNYHQGMQRDIPPRQGEHLVVVQLRQMRNRCSNYFVREYLVKEARTGTLLTIDLRAVCSLTLEFDPRTK